MKNEKINMSWNLKSRYCYALEVDIHAASTETSERCLNYDSRQSSQAVEENLVQFYRHVWWTPVLVR